MLISRRSQNNSGTKAYQTGLNDDGDCANAVETEIIVTSNNFQFSFTQNRSSAPLFWQIKPNKNKITFTRDKA